MMKQIKRGLVSLLLSLITNYALIICITFIQMVTGLYAGQIYGDRSIGIFACFNGHTDLFYCSATKFFLTIPLGAISLFAIGTYGLSIIIPAGLFYLVQKRMRHD